MEKEKKLNRKFRLRHIPFDDTIKVTKKVIQPLCSAKESTSLTPRMFIFLIIWNIYSPKFNG